MDNIKFKYAWVQVLEDYKDQEAELSKKFEAWKKRINEQRRIDWINARLEKEAFLKKTDLAQAEEKKILFSAALMEIVEEKNLHF